MPFINDIADIYNETGNNPLNSCIITPNKRAHRFLKQAIIYKKDSDGFLPKIFSIEDFISEHIPLIRIDEVDLSYILYEVFNAHTQTDEKDIDFEEFLTYSSILLQDFNELDMQLADGKDIFSYLNDAKAIQQWNPDGSELSPSQKEYLRFYNHLAVIYTKFRETLFNRGLCYQGMAYRYFAEHIVDITDELPWENIIFAGFNALTKSEEKIIKYFSTKKMVNTIWDADKYYTNNVDMEAGLYLRKYKNWTSHITDQTKNHFKEKAKNIEIIGVPGILGQARIASQIITEKTKDHTNADPSSFEDNTVIVPADESLLIPLLNSLPSHILKNTNITMGLSIQHSHAFRLTENMIQLHTHSSKISSLNTQNARLHKDDLLAVLNNNLISLLYSSKEPLKIDQSFLGEMAVSTILKQLDLSYLDYTFTSCNDAPIELVKKIQKLFNFLIQFKTNEDKNNIAPKERDALQQILQIFNRLESLITKNKKPTNLRGLQTLYKQLMVGMSQSFTGDITQGLQLMGLLETRLMDFENVIILSTNEDILPASAFTNSFIPADIRYEFDLPGIQERTAVFAYHFYRLIQRAKNIYLIYSSTKKAMSGGEKSRFIKQLEFELSKYNEKISIKHLLLNFEALKLKSPQDISIKKDHAVMQKLEYLATKGLSPTSLISYNQCSLKFYFKYIAKIYEPEDVEDIIDERIIGNVIHKILEDFYKPYLNKDFPAVKLKAFKKEIPQLIID
ncbi:MAG: PD-(D/E)XK nuclease family protein, partial [Bacteroidales bacterium]|nr:PD-(D/E)XK nuclease family protein [Bacteroidales bacterium]